MRLFDLLDKLMNNENLYAIKDESMFGVRYRKHSGFMICGRDGTYVEHPYTFDKEMTEDDSWLITFASTPKYKIGDRFLFSDLYYSEAETNGSISKTTLKNTIGEIIAQYYDGEKMQYTVSLNGNSFPLLLTEDYLNRLDMVVSQDN